jgi:hypothetical protein
VARGLDWRGLGGAVIGNRLNGHGGQRGDARFVGFFKRPDRGRLLRHAAPAELVEEESR